MPGKRPLTAAVVLAVLAVPCAAQMTERGNVREVPEGEAKAASPQCSLGVVYDDGGFGSLYSIGNGDPGDSTMVMKFDLPAGTTSLDQVCVCFSRDSAGPSSMTYDIVVYDDNGVGGQPGTFLGSVTTTANAIPLLFDLQFYSVNMTGSGITLPNTSVYIGARWPGGDILMCGDTSSGTTQRTNFGSGNSGSTWTNLTSLFPFPSTPPRALGVRIDPHTATTTCTPSSTAMCLNNNRFKVEATFQRPGAGQPVEMAQVVKLTDETGYFWFFSSVNVEAVLKVINACTFNSRFWVYAGGLTDVKVDITVTDTLTGAVKVYQNPQGAKFQPIQDSSAFATCP